ncbi:hypothetical protein ACH47Z_35040 [Streptomyces sp. NPDC020192]|uniref:hypothetical protein n=1 Tax=Streptomyces sp. NPDC020192 TaxID=3365066 RepID=UPI0037B20714
MGVGRSNPGRGTGVDGNAGAKGAGPGPSWGHGGRRAGGNQVFPSAWCAPARPLHLRVSPSSGPGATRPARHRAAVAAGRFEVEDPDLAPAVTAGATLALGSLLHAQPDRDDGAFTDLVARGLLRQFGIPADEAARICSLDLPDLDEEPAALGKPGGADAPAVPKVAG